MGCQILYNENNFHVLRKAVTNYFKRVISKQIPMSAEQSFEMFKIELFNQQVFKGELPKETRFVLKYSDDLSDLNKSVIALYEGIIECTRALSNPALKTSIEKFIDLVNKDFQIDADHTQSASIDSTTIESDNEMKTQEEIYDANRANLEDHLKEIYGLEAYDLLETLKQDYYNDFLGASYYNMKTGEPVIITNDNLNTNIKNLKESYLNIIKTYLTNNNISFVENSYKIQSIFYKHLKSITDLKDQLNRLHYNKVQNKQNQHKLNLFKEIIQILQQDPEFKSTVLNNLYKFDKDRLEHNLYSGEYYSSSYLAVRKFILDNDKYYDTLLPKIKEIENEDITLLTAVNAYSKLTHFDEMLIDRIGKQIEIQKGTEGIDVPGKYSYHQDTSHERKNWQTAEDIGSERHLSKFVQNVLPLIQIFDHQTGTYKNRKLDSTSFIVAARHLLDDILYGNINITGKGERIEDLKKLIEHEIVTFHDAPIDKLQNILALIFDTTKGVNNVPMINYLGNKRLLTNYDLDILYSVYLKVFNKKNPTSFINQETKAQFGNALISGLMQEISALVDSNITMDYLESAIDWETGEVILKVKKKYFNNQRLYKTRRQVNAHINKKSLDQRISLQKKYDFKIFPEVGTATNYTTNKLINFTLRVPNGMDSGILTSNDKKLTVSFTNSEIFKSFEDIDFINFRKYVEKGQVVENIQDKELFDNFYNTLQFIDDYLNLNILTDLGLQILQTYKLAYDPINKMKSYLMPLVQLAMRAAYVNNQYIQAAENKQSLKEYLANDTAFKYYKKYPASKLFVEDFGKVEYVIASFADSVLDKWVDAISMFTGEASKATTKDGHGNAIPNNSVGKLGGNLRYYLEKQKGTNCNTLMFVNDPSVIKSTFHDLEVKNIYGDNKSIKQFSCGELFFHSIWNKFWASYHKTGNVIIQPTVYSDKTTFLNWEIQTKLLQSVTYKEDVLDTYLNSIGIYYQNIYDDTIAKLNKLTNYYNRITGQNITYTNLLNDNNEKSLMELVKKYNQDNFNDRIELEKNKDYRVRKKTITKTILQSDGSTKIEKIPIKYCTINEILKYNTQIYNDKNLLNQALEHEKYNFLQNLIDYNTTYQVLNFQDKIEYYTQKAIHEKASSKNPIITTILSHFVESKERIQFFKDWVDAKSGKLILAKQNGKNILGIGTDFDKNEPGMILNPLLDKFFYVEGLLSNNLRLSLTGSEINHPDKANKVPFEVFKKLNYAEFINKYGNILTFQEFTQLQTDVKTCNDILELETLINNTLDFKSKQFLNKLHQDSILRITNVAQGTQFKRNVIIPATLQYCQQNLKIGIPSKIKVCTIYDKEAHVHNYRGETKTVDSADGSAKITPFQSIMENLSLGSQAVGFTKKPIWHSYDTTSGTAFLAKFATNTMTNEEMRASLHSKTSLFKLFKRMTNLEWKEPIDLTKPIHSLNSISENTSLRNNYTNWFKNVILENQELYYENKFGEKIQILELNKTTSSDGNIFYYTIEKNEWDEPVKVYHMFDKQSNHYTFDSYQKAQTFKTEHEKNHTISSLFELHTALGSIYCVDSKGNGSEFNNKVVVNFMNNIGSRKEGVERNAYINQTNYDQPLKKYHIGYALNDTAVKNGSKNINPAEAWDGDVELNYYEVDSAGLGMQMNADHDIINSELTEFSQVVAATSAYGYTYDNCDEIFKGLAKTAFEASKQVLDSVNKFLKNMDNASQSALYDAIGRIVMVEQKIKNRESLTQIISQAVEEVFTKHKDHKDDKVKWPFSDSNMYNDFISAIASNITKSSIKRKHPGSGCVMVPGYDIITYFEIGDKKYSAKDILNKSRNDLKFDLQALVQTLPDYDSENQTYKDTPIKLISIGDLLQITKNLLNDDDKILISLSDSIEFNKYITNRYLDKLQKNAPIFYDKSYFQPEDVVKILIPKIDQSTGYPLMNENGEPLMHESIIVLDSMKKYYDFKNHDYPVGTIFQVDIKTPRNLKPSLIRWRYNPTSSLEELHIIQSEVYDKPWKNDLSQFNKAFTLSLEEDPTRKFEIVKDHEEGYWSIHFKTIPEGETYENMIPLTEEQKLRLFKAAADAIPVGDKLSTWGELTPGGISGINRFKSLGFKQVEIREVTDHLGNPIQIPVYEKTGVYMNIFDHPVIKTAFDKEGKLDKDHRKAVQDVLHQLHKGFFVIEGVTHKIIPNSLENTEAELVMSNLYKDIFGIENESLQEILDQGEQYFINQLQNNIHTPQNQIYDIAMLKDNGKHTLIKFGEVQINDMCIENPFDKISVEEEVHKNSGRLSYPIYAMQGNRQLFKIGEYVNISDNEMQDLYIDEDVIKSKSGKEIDEKQYRIHGNIIQKRIDFVKRYSLTTPVINRKTKKTHYQTNVLYKIINKNDLQKLYESSEKGLSEEEIEDMKSKAISDAHKQIGSLITKLYQQDNYKFIELNPYKSEKFHNMHDTLKSYFSWFLGNNYVNPDHKDYIIQQLNHIKQTPKKDIKYLNELKKDFYKKDAHKKWISFQDSLKFISSRIPAQTLQSFMTMKCIGWTENTTNMAYVSHFQIYLQGSDYDIDKAYIMGQSYDDNGIYIQWSPLFDYTSEATLTLSKQLPVPQIVKLTKIESGININEELRILLDNTDINLIPTSYENRLKTLQAKISILKKINKANGNIFHTFEDSSKLTKIFNMLYDHIYYKIPENVAEKSYKNVASANIYAVSHDIRNRDQSYTAIAMDILQEAADKSPKGEQAATLNMLNPLTKYVMQYQNIVGKNVISIAANGEKVWFNAYYYWTKLLKEGKTKYLSFQTTLKRVAGRAGLTAKDLKSLPQEGKTVNILPDLNIRDIEIKTALLREFGIDMNTEEYAYVDQLISQLLSAATDNAKELILAKINSGNNFARMYVYLIMTGYKFDDIVSFMISPVSEFIDSMANSNMFSDFDLENNAKKSINLALGIVRSKSFLHGKYDQQIINEETGNYETHSVSKLTHVLKTLSRSKQFKEIKELLKIDPDTQFDNLDTLMQQIILASLYNPQLNIATLIKTKDTEINTYLQYCQNIAYKLQNVVAQYESLEEMQADVEEFKKIYNLASEISSISSAWLGLNQGLPTDELNLLKRFQSMRKVIIDREKSLSIFSSQMFTTSKDPKTIAKAKEYFDKVVKNIQTNNPNFIAEEIEQQLITAHEKNLIGTFDIYKYLTDDQYRQDMIEYAHYIKGTLNVLDMMEQIPHYKEIINCLRAFAVSKHTLASKSRLTNELIAKTKIENLTDKQLQGIIRYVDKLNAFNYAKSITKPLVLDKTIEGFDQYFNINKTDHINFSTLYGIATFKHWIEHEFLEELRNKYSKNPLVKHLQIVPENNRNILATDIDLLSPNTTTISRIGYDEILRGMAMFEQEPYHDTSYSIADLFQLYNILIHTNQFGSERFTTAFKACSKKDNELNKFLTFIANQDYEYKVLQDFNLIDYYINAAPIISTGKLRFSTDKFVKVNDPVKGYIIKQYNQEYNNYTDYRLIPAKDGHESEEHKLARLQNFTEYCPFEMPELAKELELLSVLEFEGEVTEDIIKRIQNLLLDFSISGKLIAFKNC